MMVQQSTQEIFITILVTTRYTLQIVCSKGLDCHLLPTVLKETSLMFKTDLTFFDNNSSGLFTLLVLMMKNMETK